MTNSDRHFGPGAAALIVLGCIAFLPALDCGFIWDDDFHVVNNPTLQDTAGLGRIWFEVGATPQYYPLVFSSFWLEARAFGIDPFVHHLVNILLHVLGAIVVWRILTRLSVPGAFLAAALFAIHPVHVESVVWISERKNVLSGLFYLLALMTYLRFTGIGDSNDDTAPRPLVWVAAFLLFCAALLSKSVTCSLPAAILLLIWWQRGRLTRTDVLPTIPFFVAGAAMATWTSWVEKTHIGIGKLDLGLSLVDRFLVAGHALWFYLGKLLMPIDLTFIYPRWVIDATDPLQYLYPVGAIVLVAVLWSLRRRIGRGPLTAMLFFGGTLIPALGFVDFYPMVYSFVADHFQYLASLGPLALGAALLARTSWLSGPVGRAAGVLLIVVLGLMTWRQCAPYQNAETLWRHTLAKNPSSVMASINLAIIRRFEGKLDEAMLLLQEAREVDPDLVNYNIRGMLHYNLGYNLVLLQDCDEAIRHFQTALEIHPGYYEATFGLGWAHAVKGDTDLAARYFREVLAIDPNHHRALAWLYRLAAVGGEPENP